MMQLFCKRAAAIVAAVGLVFTTAACGSRGGSQAGSSKAPAKLATASASLDPCAMLTSDEVAQAIGKKVDKGEAQDEVLYDSRACNWQMQATGYVCAKDITGVTLELVQPPQALKPRFPTAEAYYPQLLGTLKQAGNTVHEVQGIGDAAFISEGAAKKGLDVYARKGDAFLRVFSICAPPATLQPALEGLMKQALAKA
jgi:hypothetical protein